jgi:integrase/recombinase XerD
VISNDELFDGFLAHQRHRMFSAQTIKRRAFTLRNLGDFLDGDPIQRVTLDDLERFVSRWTSPQSRQSITSDLRVFFRWCRAREHIVKDPTEFLEAPRLKNRAASPIPPADVRRAITAASGRTRTMIMLAAFAGLRVSEIGALRGEDVRWDEELIVVRDGKGGKDRIVPLAPELAAELARYPQTGPLFPGHPGRGRYPDKVGLSPERVSQLVVDHLRALDIPGRAHDFRHGFCTELIRASNGNVVLVAQLMGHDHIATTQRYCAWRPDGRDIVASLYAQDIA